jgi:spore germination cell wall hydrolase CwlJ-like protein
MAFQTTRNTALFDDHSINANVLQPLGKDEILKSANEKATADNRDWVKVIFKPPGGVNITGWVIEAHCQVVPDVRPDLGVDGVTGLVRSAFMLEQLLNVMTTTPPWFVNAEFIIARAIIETGVTNAGPKAEPTAAGPLQVSSNEWSAFLRDGGTFAKDFKAADADSDRDDPQLQIFAAVFRMHADAKAISGLKQTPGANPADKFIPTYLDIFHAYLLNSPKAAVALINAQNDDAGKNSKVDVLLNSVMTPAEVSALFAARSKYLGAPGVAKTVAEFVEATKTELAKALEKALDLVKQHAPENLLPPPSSPLVIPVVGVPTNVAQVPDGNAVPFATINTPANQMFWPVITDDPQAMVVSYLDTAGKIVGQSGRRFFADRRGGARHHVGMDVFCKDGDVVVACAPGKIIAFYSFYKRPTTGEDTFALFIAHDGVVINYGEVKPNARAKFGWNIGDTVTAGQHIAEVSGTDMIHFETYVPGTTQNARWLAGGAKPASLLNPTMLLLTLASGATRINKNGTTSVAAGSAKIKSATEEPLDDGDILTLARTIYGEARSQKEPATGREAVGHVVMNRVQRKHMGDTTITKVCRRDRQFSCWNQNDPNLAVILAANRGSNPIFDQCCSLAEQVAHAQLPDNTGTATHYYSDTISRPDWANPPAKQTTKIGSHLFFKDVK